jgi:hypothetical protein
MASVLMPELHQELAGWLERTSRQWPWRPRLRLTTRDVRIRLEGLHPALSIRVTSTELCVSVDWHGCQLDTLLWLDMAPLRVDGVYVCTLCTQPNPETFESLAAMRQDHLYQPLLWWCQQTLAFASHVEVYQQSGACTARLVLRRDSDEGTLGTTAPVKPNTRRWPLFVERKELE